MLNISDLNVFFGKIQILHRVSLQVRQGEIVTVIGNNGAGKSTLLNTIAGINSVTSGSIEYNNSQILRKQPEAIAKLGISLICQGGRVFRGLSVLENLNLGAFLRNNSQEIEKDMSVVFEIFPMLRNRLKWQGGKLSGGEQQMLAISRSLMSNPDLLMMDEPSFGLSPLMVKELSRVIKMLRDRGKTILLVEQNARMALDLAERAYVFEVGKVVLEGTGRELLNDSNVRNAYLGH